MSIIFMWMTDYDKNFGYLRIYYEEGGILTTVIYVDKLLAVNLFIGVILLLSASKICGIHIKRKGLILGSLLSALSSLLIFLPWDGAALWIILKSSAVTAIVYFTFFPRSVKSFLKSLCAFFAVNFIFAGMILALKLLVSPNGVYYINGTVYFDISALMLVIMFVLCYGALCLGQYTAAKRANKCDRFEIEVSFRGKTVRTDALLDSGSSVKESFSGRPVIVSELKSVAGLLEPSELSYFKGDFLNGNAPETIKSTVRLIPYKALGCDGLLPSFKADLVKSLYDGKEYSCESVYIGVITNELSSGEYRAIANKMIFES